MTHDQSLRGGASKSRQLQALGSILLGQTDLLGQSDEQSTEAPEPDLSFSVENCFADEGEGAAAAPDEAFDPAWAHGS